MARTPEQQLRNVSTLIATLQLSRFYGEAAVQFQGGNVVLVRLTQTIKFEEVQDDKTMRSP